MNRYENDGVGQISPVKSYAIVSPIFRCLHPVFSIHKIEDIVYTEEHEKEKPVSRIENNHAKRKI